MTTEHVKNFLLRYQEDARDFAQLQERLSMLRARAGAARIAHNDGIPHGNDFRGDSVGVTVAQLDALTAVVQAAEEALDQKRAEIERVIDLLKAKRVFHWPEKTALLRLRYIDGLPWNDAIEICFGAAADYWERPESFLRRGMKYHTEALAELAELADPEIICE